MTDDWSEATIKSWIVFEFLTEDGDQKIYRSISVGHKVDEQSDFESLVEALIDGGVVSDWRNRYGRNLGPWHLLGYRVVSDAEHEKLFPDKARIVKEIDLLNQKISQLQASIDQLP